MSFTQWLSQKLNIYVCAYMFVRAHIHPIHIAFINLYKVLITFYQNFNHWNVASWKSNILALCFPFDNGDTL